jgi:uncharacterized protein (TIGR02270 family)
MVNRAPCIIVIQQHVEDAVVLRNTRSYLVSSSHVKLHQLRRLDDRLAAHFDGLSVAGEHAAFLGMTALQNPGRGEIFTATVCAIENREPVNLEKILSITEQLREIQTAMVSAFGWVSPTKLHGITKALLDSHSTFRQQIGLATCAMHQVNPTVALTKAFNNSDIDPCIRAFKVAGELGLIERLPNCINALSDTNPDCAYHAARAGVLLGDRSASPSKLRLIALTAAHRQSCALALLLKLQSSEDAHATLKTLAQDPACIRLLIRGIGTAGDPHYVPWLIQQMQDLKLSRLAGESFSYITGLDLAYLDLERKPPEGVDFGPNDDPNDYNVAMDEDDGLPWPDVEKISAWWQANGQRFAPGTRYFMGEPPSTAHCLDVLKNGFQRQRMAAAIYLCLLKPGTPLFNCAAPAWRQQRLLAKMGA